MALLLALALAGAAWWRTDTDGNRTEPYISLPVSRDTIEQTVSAVGVLQPVEFVDVGTQVSGQLLALHVEIGRQVKKNDLVAEIDPTLFKAKLEEAGASLRTFQAQLIDRSAQLRLAQDSAARKRRLYAAAAVSLEALEQGRTAEDQAAAQVDVLKAQIEQAQSQLAAAEANLRYTKIYAPMAGTVVSLAARQGQTLVASQAAPTIMRIANLATMTVWAQTSEIDVPKIALGMPVYFNTLGQPERRWQSSVRQIYPTPETLNNVVLYDVLFDVANPGMHLKPQMSAQVYFVLARAEHALLVPVAALQPLKPDHGSASKGSGQSGANSYTVRVLRKHQLEQRRVTIGMRNRVVAQVLDGLNEGEQVVVGTAAPGRKAEQTAPKPLQSGLRSPGRP